MKKIIFFLTAISLLAFHGCEKDPGTIDNRITITDKVITSLRSADISGTISCPIENINVELLVDDAEDMSAPTKYNIHINSDNSFTVNITDLNPTTTYYYKFRAYTNLDDIEFEIKSFTTTTGEGTLNGYDWVDLGLPSGLKWATCNVGTISPTDVGALYAWGDIVPYGEGYTADDILDISGNPEHDAARANLGGDWRMPTAEETQELIDNCNFEVVREEGVPTYIIVTGRNSNQIILPLYDGDGSYVNQGILVLFWTSSMWEYSDYDGSQYVPNLPALIINETQLALGFTSESAQLPIRPVFSNSNSGKSY